MALEQGLNSGFQQIPFDGSKLDMNFKNFKRSFSINPYKKPKLYSTPFIRTSVAKWLLTFQEWSINHMIFKSLTKLLQHVEERMQTLFSSRPQFSWSSKTEFLVSSRFTSSTWFFWRQNSLFTNRHILRRRSGVEVWTVKLEEPVSMYICFNVGALAREGFCQSLARGTWECQFILELVHFGA